MDRAYSPIVICIATTTLGGCGGLSSNFNSVPLPPPPPPKWAQPLSLEGSQELTVLTPNGEEGEIALRYDAGRDMYLMSYPGAPEGGVRLLYDDGYTLNARLADPASGDPNLETTVRFYHAGDAAPEYSVRGSAFTTSEDYYSEFIAVIPTAAADMPITGSATYAVSGGDGNTSVTGAFAFDFAAGTLGGFLDASLYDDWGGSFASGHFDLVESVYGVGSTSFSSSLLNPDEPDLGGSIYGLFAGPGAEELAGRYSMDLRGSGSIYTIVGLFSGQRQ